MSTLQHSWKCESYQKSVCCSGCGSSFVKGCGSLIAKSCDKVKSCKWLCFACVSHQPLLQILNRFSLEKFQRRNLWTSQASCTHRSCCSSSAPEVGRALRLGSFRITAQVARIYIAETVNHFSKCEPKAEMQAVLLLSIAGRGKRHYDGISSRKYRKPLGTAQTLHGNASHWQLTRVQLRELLRCDSLDHVHCLLETSQRPWDIRSRIQHQNYSIGVDFLRHQTISCWDHLTKSL